MGDTAPHLRNSDDSFVKSEDGKSWTMEIEVTADCNEEYDTTNFPHDKQVGHFYYLFIHRIYPLTT